MPSNHQTGLYLNNGRGLNLDFFVVFHDIHKKSDGFVAFGWMCAKVHGTDCSAGLGMLQKHDAIISMYDVEHRGGDRIETEQYWP